MACDLRQHCSYIGMQVEILVAYKKATYPTKVNAPKEIMQINIEYKATGDMCSSVCQDGMETFKPVRDSLLIFAFNIAVCRINFNYALLQQSR